MDDRLIPGMANIAAFIGWSKVTLYKRQKELIRAGVLIEMRRGRPPRTMWCAWESAIKIWMAMKAQKGEIL